MPRIDGPSRDDIARRGDELSTLMVSAVWYTLNSVTNKFSGTVTLDDIAPIYTVWKTYVPGLRDHIGQTYLDGAAQTRERQRDALVQILKRNGVAVAASLVAAAGDESPFEIPQVANQQAETIMAEAENRLTNVGNEVWEHARGELLIGLQNGEGIPDLRDRVSAATDLSTTRAEMIARTEIAGAMNAGSLDQMKQINVAGMTKEWIGTDDGRERPEHVQANGEKTTLDGVFSNGLEPGEEPNCRCTYGYDIPDDDTFAQSVTGCDDPMLSSLVASIDTNDPRYQAKLERARLYRTDQRLKREAQRAAGEIVPVPEPIVAPLRSSIGSTLQQAMLQLQRDDTLTSVSACEAPVVTNDDVTWFDDPYDASLSPGMNARFQMDDPVVFARQLADTGVDAETRDRIIKLNRSFGERFGTPISRAENTSVLESRPGVKAGRTAYIRDGKTLGVSPKLLTDRQVLTDEIKAWGAKGSGKLEDVIVHEHGHVFLNKERLTSKLPWKSAKSLTDIMAKAEQAARAAGAPPGVLGSSLGKYAMTSAREAEAELWMNYHMAGASREPWVIKWGETLLREMGLDTTPLCVDLGLCDAIAKCASAGLVGAATEPTWCATVQAAEKFVTKDLYEQITRQAAEKIAGAPIPSAAAIKKAQIELANARAGTGRAGGESRGGSAADRRKQRHNLFKEFGGEDRGYIVCHGCGMKIHWADPGSIDNPHGYARFERGKIFVKCQGGGYQLANLLPECFACNRSRNDQVIRLENACK